MIMRWCSVQTNEYDLQAILRWIPWGPTNDMSTLGQAMVWCRQAKRQCLIQCLHRSLSIYGVTRTQLLSWLAYWNLNREVRWVRNIHHIFLKVNLSTIIHISVDILGAQFKFTHNWLGCGLASDMLNPKWKFLFPSSTSGNVTGGSNPTPSSSGLVRRPQFRDLFHWDRMVQNEEDDVYEVAITWMVFGSA